MEVAWPSLVLASALFIIAVSAIVLGILVVARRSTPGNRTFALLMVGMTIWSIAYAIELLQPTLAGKFLWARIEYFGVTSVPVIWFFLALRLARTDLHPPRSLIAALCTIPAATLFAALGPASINGLLWTSAHIQVEHSISLLRLTHGPVFWIFTIYGYVLVLTGTIFLARSLGDSPGPFRRQRLSLVVACAAPFLGSVWYVAGLGPIKGLSLAPFGFALSGVAFAWGLLRQGLFDIAPIARGVLVESMEDFVVVIDRRGRIVDMNPALLQAFDLSGDKVIGRKISEILTGQAELIERYRGTIEERSQVAIDVRGQQRWFDLGISPIRGATGRLTGRLIVLRDVTEQKQITDAFRESEKKYRSILENIEEGYFELDLKGTIIHCNQVLAKIIGHPAENLIGLNYRQYTDSETAAWLKDVFSRIYRTGETLHDLNHKILHSDGTFAHVEVASMPVADDGGATIGFRGLVRDVTERKRAEDALRDAQERISRLLEAASGPAVHLSEWATAVAHEIRTAIGVESIGLWEVEESTLTPLNDVGASAPPLAEILTMATAVRTDLGTIVPVTTTSGEVCGVMVVSGGTSSWGATEERILLAFARQLGSALEMRRLRRQLASADEQRAARTQELKDQGVQLLRICHRCGHCFPDDVLTCTQEGLALDSPRVLPYRLAHRYRFVKVIGAGGMGMVLSAIDEKLQREVAIKLVRPDHFKSSELRRRFEREARTVAQIQHPGVIALFDAGELDDGTTFLVMERLNGFDLEWILADRGPGRADQVAALVRATSSALNAAHRLGVVHRDVKPGNIFLVNEAGEIRFTVLDFGLAKSMGTAREMTLSGAILGTPAYMAPEQIQGEVVDARADVYSLGCVAYEALLGRRVASGEKLGEIIVSVLKEKPEPASSFHARFPQALDQIFDEALAKNPLDRATDIEGWGASLAAMLESLSPDPSVLGWPATPSHRQSVLGPAEPTLAGPAVTSAFW